MIEWLKDWANQIIVAIVIAIIFELIIPNGKNKKYIKMVINLYVLFVLLNPIVSKFNGISNLSLSDFDYKKYIGEENSIQTSSTVKSDEIIKSTMENSIKQDITNKLLSEGYKINSISIDIDNNNKKINSIRLSIEKKNEESNNTVSNIEVNKVEEVNINSENKKSTDSKIKKKEIENVKKIISEEYNISKDKIEEN